MKIPKALRDQIKFYAARGFNVIHAEHRAGSHFLVKFKEFDEPKILTAHVDDPRAMKNNLAEFKRAKERKNAMQTQVDD